MIVLNYVWYRDLIIWSTQQCVSYTEQIILFQTKQLMEIWWEQLGQDTRTMDGWLDVLEMFTLWNHE